MGWDEKRRWTIGETDDGRWTIDTWQNRPSTIDEMIMGVFGVDEMNV
jgi:hypothetical protein